MTAAKYETIPKGSLVEKTAESLKANGIDVIIADNGEQARQKILEIIPKGANVMAMTSVTLDTVGATKEIEESGRYNSIRKKLMGMDRNKQGQEMNRLGSAPDYVVGSVHAVTQDGSVLIASQSGSQLPAYAYGAGKVLWVVGAHKIVKNFEEGLKRVYEHSLPLESERARIAYGVPGSAVNKLLVLNKEIKQGRITIIIVKEKLGF